MPVAAEPGASAQVVASEAGAAAGEGGVEPQSKRQRCTAPEAEGGQQGGGSSLAGEAASAAPGSDRDALITAFAGDAGRLGMLAPAVRGDVAGEAGAEAAAGTGAGSSGALPEQVQQLYTQPKFRVPADREEEVCPHCPCLVPRGYPIDLHPLWLHALK